MQPVLISNALCLHLADDELEASVSQPNPFASAAPGAQSPTHYSNPMLSPFARDAAQRRRNVRSVQRCVYSPVANMHWLLTSPLKWSAAASAEDWQRNLTQPACARATFPR